MVKLRSEVKKEDTWALEEMYPKKEALEKDYQYLVEHLTDLSKHKGHVLDSAQNLLETLRIDNQLSLLLEKVCLFTAMTYDVDTTDGEALQQKNKMLVLESDMRAEAAYLKPELLAGTYEQVEKFIEGEPALKEFERSLQLVYRLKGHTLTEAEESLLSKVSNLLNSGNTSAYALRNSDLTYGDIQDEAGNIIELTSSNYSKLVSSKDRNIRKQAFEQYHAAYQSLRNTFASLYHTEVQKHVMLAELYHYQSAREMALYQNEIDEKIYDQLLEGVHESLPLLFDYYHLKKEVLGLEELHLYDIYAPLVPEKDVPTYTFEEAKQLVIDALGILGNDYQNLVRQAFEERWIDRYSNKGKRSGAYSWGGYESKSYILTNFEGTYHDVSTLAHEIGHSIHSYYSKKHNPFQNYHYKIFVAEVASTTNELLFNDYMLKHSQNKNEKLLILNQQMELFKSTIYRQAMFAEAEQLFHQKVAAGDTLTADWLEATYYHLNKTYFGPDVVVDKTIQSEWSRIPHFYMNFYVYQYATGLSAASKIVSNLLTHKQGALESYLKFLTLGGSLPPVEELKVAGVDMNQKKTIMEALQLFQKTMDQFRLLMQERN